MVNTSLIVDFSIDENIGLPPIINEDLHQALRQSLFYKGLFLLLFILGYFIGIPFYALLIHFEKNGQDPLKRTLWNRIIVFMSYFMIWALLITQPIGCFSILIGPIHSLIAHLQSYMICVQGILLMVSASQLVLIENLMLFKFSAFSGMDEDFFTTFIYIWNLAFAIGSQTVLSLKLDHFMAEEIQLLTGKWYPKGHFPLFTKFLIFISSLIIIFGSVIKTLKKKIEDKRDKDRVIEIHIPAGTGPTLEYNNNARNLPLVSGTQAKMISFSSFISFLFFSFYRDPNVIKSINPHVFGYCFSGLFYSLIVPITYIVQKKDFRKYVLELLK